MTDNYVKFLDNQVLKSLGNWKWRRDMPYIESRVQNAEFRLGNGYIYAFVHIQEAILNTYTRKARNLACQLLITN